MYSWQAPATELGTWNRPAVEVTDEEILARWEEEDKGQCPAPSHFSPLDDRYNTKLITTADCGWCGEPVVVRG